jgi:TnsA endonuclease-like protein
MHFSCVCGKEFKAIQGLNGHKTYCKQAGGKSYFELVKGNSLTRLRIGHARAREVRIQQGIENAAKRVPKKCSREGCKDFIGPEGILYCSTRCAGIVNSPGRKHSGWKLKPEALEKLVVRLHENILSGKHNPHKSHKKKLLNTIKGGEIFCQSTWEEAYANHLESNILVVSFKKDKIRLPYMFENKKRVYITDYFVKYSDGTQELVEIKPKCFLDYPQNTAKFEAAKIWCNDNGARFVIITEDELTNMVPLAESGLGTRLWP